VHQVRVGVDQAGDDGVTAQVDDVGVRPGMREDRGALADGQHLPAADRDGLAEGFVLIAGNDAGAVQHNRAHR